MLVELIKRQRTLEVVRRAAMPAPSPIPPPLLASRDEQPVPAPETVYAPAFARVRLVRAWIGVAAAVVALSYAFAGLLDRLLPW